MLHNHIIMVSTSINMVYKQNYGYGSHSVLIYTNHTINMVTIYNMEGTHLPIYMVMPTIYIFLRVFRTTIYSIQEHIYVLCVK